MASRHIANEHIRKGSNSYEKAKTFKYLGFLVTNQNSVQGGIKCRLEAENSCYYTVQTFLSSRLSSQKLKYVKQYYCQWCYMVVKYGLLH